VLDRQKTTGKPEAPWLKTVGAKGYRDRTTGCTQFAELSRLTTER
jgi:hypothetical protein